MMTKMKIEDVSISISSICIRFINHLISEGEGKILGIKVRLNVYKMLLYFLRPQRHSSHGICQKPFSPPKKMYIPYNYL